MPRRLVPPRDAVSITLDGERIVAERGEPIAAALLGAGKWTLARSPKFHRPRGPSCMRGACDGCLARVDGVANVMTCMVAAHPGAIVTSQNTLGSREIDVLRMTDWFFPDGMNHHELFAGVPGVQSAMQLFARRVAGLGLLPEPRAVEPPRDARRKPVDVLVVGAGPAGMAMAVAASSANGAGVLVVDDALAPGGSARGLTQDDDAGLASIRERFDRAVAAGRVHLRSRTVAAAVFGRDVLVVGPGEGDEAAALVLEPRALVLASGAHDGVVPFENNDLPGVMSARAACLLAAAGVSIGDRVVLLSGPSEGVSFGDAFERSVAREAGSKRRVTRVTEVVRAKGSSHVRGVVVRDQDGESSLRADALVVDAARAPAYELCEQAGATLAHRPSGFAPVATRGLIADGVWAIGEVTGAPLEARAFEAAAADIAAQL